MVCVCASVSAHSGSEIGLRTALSVMRLVIPALRAPRVDPLVALRGDKRALNDFRCERIALSTQNGLSVPVPPTEEHRINLEFAL